MSNNEMTLFNNEDFGTIRTAILNNEPLFCLIDICKALDIKNATDVTKRLDDDEVTRLNLGSKSGETNFVTESGLYAVILRSDKANAKKFRKWVTAEVLPALRKNGTYTTQTSNKSRLEQEIIIVKFIADDLRINDASRLLMYEGFCKDNNISTGFLPKYELNSNRQMKALSTLLKENGCDLSAVKFNLLLLESGYLEERKRPSSKGETKKFKALTEKGLEYGENALNPHNQKEVQPLYYADTFMELYNNVANGEENTDN